MKKPYLCTQKSKVELMKHYCIFEISHPNKNSENTQTRFVDDYGEDYTAAEEMCTSMNNFRKPEEEVRFCVRCLEQEEFDDVQNYNPIIKAMVLRSKVGNKMY